MSVNMKRMTMNKFMNMNHMTMNSMNQILSDAWLFMNMVDAVFFSVIFGLREWVISKVLEMRNGDHKTKTRLLSSLKKLFGE